VRDVSSWACCATYPKEPLPLVLNGIKSGSLGLGSASQQPARPNRVGLALPSPTPPQEFSLPFSRWLRGTPAQPVGPQWAAPGGPWPSPGLTRDPRSGRGGVGSFPPSFSLFPLRRDSASGPLPCAPARGGKCEAPLRVQAKPNSPPPQTLSHWRIRGAIGTRG
jgi:hypothetical protein